MFFGPDIVQSLIAALGRRGPPEPAFRRSIDIDMGKAVEKRLGHTVCCQRIVQVVARGSYPGVFRKQPFPVYLFFKDNIEGHALDRGQSICQLVEKDDMKLIRLRLAFILELYVPGGRNVRHLAGLRIVYALAV